MEIIKKTELQKLLEIKSQNILISAMAAQEQGWREKNLSKRNKCYRTYTYLKRIAENLQILKEMHKLED